MRSFTLLSLALSLSHSSLRAGASPSPSELDAALTDSEPFFHLNSASSHGAISSPHIGLSAFSKRATAAISRYSGPLKGHATYYGNDGSGGACSLPSRSDLKFAAFSGAKWDNSANCGACIRVTGPNGVIDVQVIDEMSPLSPLSSPPTPSERRADLRALGRGGDYCPGCPAGSVDLSTSAFSKIAPISAGVVDVSWQFISCVAAGLEKGSVSVVWKSGSSAYWMAIQIRGAAFPVQSVAIRAASASTYTTLNRETYNYFSATSGVGAGPFVVLVRYQNGSKTIIKNVKLNSAVEENA